MNTNEQIVSNSRDRYNHQELKQYLKEKYTNKMVVAYAGGMFTANKELIAFVSSSECDIITDIYDNPTKINRLEFLDLIIETYNSVMSQWLDEYTKLLSKR